MKVIGNRLLGGRMKNLATGGAPTPPRDLEFAQNLCRTMGVSFVDSYGTTESGAISADGQQLGAKFSETDVRLVDRPAAGFTTKDVPAARGEVVVKSSSLALGYFGQPDVTQQ